MQVHLGRKIFPFSDLLIIKGAKDSKRDILKFHISTTVLEQNFKV